MKATVSLKGARGEITAISSKSDAHRCLIAAALSQSESRIYLNASSLDIEATVGCLRSLGAKITRSHGCLEVSPVSRSDEPCLLDCGESGSTIRFLVPVAAALGRSCVFTGSGRLPERPMSPLLNALRSHSLTVSPDGVFPIKISGKLGCGEFLLPGNVSSQYITGLMLALPLLGSDSIIRLTPPVESRPYIDLTLGVLNKFGVNVQGGENEFFIKGNQRYISPGSIQIQADWSNGAFFVCLGALSYMNIRQLNEHSLQGDKKIADAVRQMGAQVIFDEGGVKVSGGSLSPILFDAGDTPDLVPVVAALAAFAKGETRIYNAARLRLKESDRLSEMAALLGAAGVKTLETDDSLTVFGTGCVKERFRFDAKNDHRLVMAASLLSFGGVAEIENAQAVNKSYPSFFDDIKSVGASVELS